MTWTNRMTSVTICKTRWFASFYRVPFCFLAKRLSADRRLRRHTHLVHKLQLLPSANQPIGVDKAAAHWSRVENHVSCDAHQNVPIVSCVREATHRNAEKERKDTWRIGRFKQGDQLTQTSGVTELRRVGGSRFNLFPDPPHPPTQRKKADMMTDYRPVSLTSVVTKSFVCPLWTRLRTITTLPFNYKAVMSVGHAVKMTLYLSSGTFVLRDPGRELYCCIHYHRHCSAVGRALPAEKPDSTCSPVSQHKWRRSQSPVPNASIILMCVSPPPPPFVAVELNIRLHHQNSWTFSSG